MFSNIRTHMQVQPTQVCSHQCKCARYRYILTPWEGGRGREMGEREERDREHLKLSMAGCDPQAMGW